MATQPLSTEVWVVSSYHKDVVFVAPDADGQSGDFVCRVDRGPGCFANDRATANSIARAHLISAAPELRRGAALALEIAERLAHEYLGGDTLSRVLADLDSTRNALAKAEAA